jgi:deoxyribose-phosphate aldolase
MTDLSRIAKALQHTNVTPAARRDDILHLCDEAIEFGFDGVMVQPCWITTCSTRLAGTAVKTCSAMAYPMGGSLTRSKAAEMRHLVEEGAQEVDAMANAGFLVSGDVDAYEDEWAAMVQAAGPVPVKAMLELGALPRDLWAAAIERAEAGGVAWVKNSSGWGEGGKATPEIIYFMKAHARRARVKASGGIRTEEDARAILAAGAELLGSSAGPAIMKGRVGALAY